MRAAARGSAEAAQVRVDLGESFQFLSMSLFLNLLFEQDSYSNEYLLVTCKFWRRYSQERASQSLPKISQKLEKEG